MPQWVGLSLMPINFSVLFNILSDLHGYRFITKIYLKHTITKMVFTKSIKIFLDLAATEVTLVQNSVLRFYFFFFYRCRFWRLLTKYIILFEDKKKRERLVFCGPWVRTRCVMCMGRIEKAVKKTLHTFVCVRVYACVCRCERNWNVLVFFKNCIWRHLHQMCCKRFNYHFCFFLPEQKYPAIFKSHGAVK